MCSISNKELLLAGTALKMYQGLNCIPGYSAFTATGSIAHHSSSMQGEDWGKANSDQGTTPSLQGHGSPPCKMLFSIQGNFSFKCASRAVCGITPVLSKENEPTQKCPLRSLFKLSELNLSESRARNMTMDISTSRAETVKSS